MRALPEDINECVGLLIKIKPDADSNTVNVYGIDKYYFDISTVNPSLPVNDRIRLHPVNQENLIVLDKVHILASMEGYDKLKEKFQVVGTGFDTAGTVKDL